MNGRKLGLLFCGVLALAFCADVQGQLFRRRAACASGGMCAGVSVSYEVVQEKAVEVIQPEEAQVQAEYHEHHAEMNDNNQLAFHHRSGSIRGERRFKPLRRVRGILLPCSG